MQASFLTARLHLNLLTLADDEFIALLVNSPGWLRFIGDRNVHNKEDAIAYMNKIMATKDLFYWVVRLKDDGIPIGIISFMKRAYLKNFDIGFAFLPAFAGCGYAYEAASKVLSIIGEDPKYYPVLATTLPHNKSSIKLLHKLNFHFEKEIVVENLELHIYSNLI